ncbi:ribosome biogenesis protein BRX1 homolog [Perognathus longimembris pacificus]|uniref:ribosome biogenesis protein BRX1 homolog n=1 Tax=Perognathus longimembris pacificus TaxID=214514 RepID=UPI0020195466|nr:ribosome biogenesis protein BRX1 homolog [Perognathus longimembris pacificus]
MAATKRKRRGGLLIKAKKPKKDGKDAGKPDMPSGKAEVEEEDRYCIPGPVCKGKWKNKERVLIFSSRGINFRTRHLMQDLRMLMPHSKADTKMDRKDKLFVINEVCEMKNCNKCIYFEAKKKQDLYMWLSNSPHGPSAKFLVQNIHTLAELKMTGNCLKGSRPLLSFDPAFDELPHYALLKELLIQIFSTPRYHPKSQPFVDHVFTFTILDNRIWFRNFQIIEEDAALVEIGPRFVLNLIKIFQGSFGGPTLYENPHYQSPNMHRRIIRSITAAKYKEKQQVKDVQKLKKKEPKTVLPPDPTEDVFAVPVEEKPIEIQWVKPEPKVDLKARKKRVYKRQRKIQQKMNRGNAK